MDSLFDYLLQVPGGIFSNGGCGPGHVIKCKHFFQQAVDWSLLGGDFSSELPWFVSYTFLFQMFNLLLQLQIWYKILTVIHAVF